MTLYHLYTVAALILALALIYRLFRCAHKWELVDKTELPSRIEVMCKSWRPERLNLTNDLEIAKSTTVIVMRCDRCGAAKIIKLHNG